MARGALLAAAAAAATSAAQPYGPIASLPGYTGPALSMWSGYVTVNATNGRALFFWFVESANATADKLVTWTNGGPGCSSLGGGLFEEHGPFRPDPAGSGNLVANPWSWHLAQHMLYVEQPAGVGFSYSNTSSDYTTGDAQSAADYATFLQAWLSLPDFASYRSLDLYVTGESYGGHYVPSTTAEIVRRNADGQQPAIQLGGFMVGNAWTDAFYDNTGAVEQWFWHGMISNETRNGIYATCNMSTVGPLMHTTAALREEDTARTVGGVTLRPGAMGFLSRDPEADPVTGGMALPTYKGETCNDYQNDASTQMGNTDIYDVYSDVCTAAVQEALTVRGRWAARHGAHHAAARRAAITAITDSNVAAGCAAEYDPCIDSKVATYLNRADVQAAINVIPSTIPGGSWVGCSSVVNYSYSDLLSSMLPTYIYLLTAYPQGRYLVFSGDVDGIVPFTGSRLWLEQLGLNLSVTNHPYNTAQGQVAGWSYSYVDPASNANLVFATVRNAGHLVPAMQGSRGLQLFSTWMSGNSP